jgi:hypothetical protein
MALEAGQPTGKMSMDDIAASMIVSADPEKEEETTADAADDSVEDQVATSESDADSDATATDDADNDDDENFETFQLTDDTLIPVTVDGEGREVTLADLKRAYSGEGAIEKRLQVATETKKQAESLKVQVEQELNSGRQNLVKAFTAFESLMFQSQVPQPNPALQQTNPTQYLIQLENWRAEQGELQEKRSKVQQAVSLFQQQEAEQLNQMKANAAHRLVEAMPVLRDPVKGPEIQRMMVDAARAYQFNDAELSEIVDHRLYLVLADAAAYRQLKAKGQAAPQKQTKATVTMRPGTSKTVAAASSIARNQKAALETARKSGRVEDIAATMLVRKPKR